LLFDEVSYVTADIVPLPPQEANPQALREILKDGSMFDILKGMIGN